MDLKHLEYFVLIGQLGSFAKAGEILDIPQPTLSRKIRALEIEINANLFRRTGRGVVLTPEGTRFAEQVQSILHATEIAMQGLRPGNQRLTGHVACGLTPSVGSLMIPEFVRRFRRQLPDATLSIVNNLSTTLHDQIRAGRLDFAVYHNAPRGPTVAVERLGSEKLYLVGSTRKGNRSTVSMSELDGLPLVMPSRLHAIRGPVETEAIKLGISLNIVIEVDDMASVLKLVSEGVGHSIATRLPLASGPNLQGLTAQQIVKPSLVTHICLVTDLENALTPLQMAAKNLARSVYLDLITEATQLNT